MRAIAFPGDDTTLIREFDDPAPGPGEVIVQVRASGMCGSDLLFRRGAIAVGADIIQGHEPCGDVYAVGDGVTPMMARVGDRVMIHHYWGCNACPSCRSGWPQMCEREPSKVMGISAHGGHAPFLKVPARTLLPLPDTLSYKAGAAIGCGTGTAWGGLQRLGNVAGETMVIFGQGPVGLSGTMLASALGANVIAVDIDDNRLQRAKSFGATSTIDSRSSDVVEAIADLTGGRGAPLILETSGKANDDALAVLAPWGRACFLGLPGHIEFDVQAHYKKQWTLMTSWTMSTIEQLRCAEFIAARNLPIDDIYTHTWTLEQGVEAYEWFAQQSDGKGVFEF